MLRRDRLESGDYYYDVDNMERVTSNWDIEFNINKKTDISLNSFVGNITNIKIFNIYNDNI